MEELKFYMTMLKLMLEKQKENEKPRRWRNRKQKRFQRYSAKRPLRPESTRPQKSLRGGQTIRSKNRSNQPQH